MESRQYHFDPSTCLPNRANLPQSQSEHNFRRIEDTQQPTFDIPRRHRANSEEENFSDRIVHRIPSPTSPKRSPSPTRGRFFGRSPSPTRNLEDLDEDEVFQYGSSPKRSRSPKKLFGEGGWLGKSPSIKEKKSGIKQLSDKLKQGIEDLTEGIKALPAAFHQETSPTSEPTNSKFPVSLDPPTQARIYAEIELMICVTANKFLITQYDAGRTSLDSVKKITDYWSSLNRPQVIEFQFDQATQRELILANLKTFEFNGEAKDNPIVLHSVLYNWRVIAKEMSVRTFCTPDSVVRKHMHDVHKILEMLGAPLVTFLAFQEIQIKALDTIKKEQEKRMMRN